MRQIASIAVFAVALAGCQTSNLPPASVKKYTLNAKEIEAVQSGVRRSLKDPASAIFGPRMGAAKGADGALYVCGMVNAKNSFGGYTGESPYIGVLASYPLDGKTIAAFNMASMASDQFSFTYIANECTRRGASII